MQLCPLSVHVYERFNDRMHYSYCLIRMEVVREFDDMRDSTIRTISWTLALSLEPPPRVQGERSWQGSSKWAGVSEMCRRIETVKVRVARSDLAGVQRLDDMSFLFCA